ncbi:hypothetical protein DFH27DRAFT_566673 [Peziza echinospora]|nr:hypothetical protein DFH27DRAFT_566673 [Peziza echinospora]
MLLLLRCRLSCKDLQSRPGGLLLLLGVRLSPNNLQSYSAAPPLLLRVRNSSDGYQSPSAALLLLRRRRLSANDLHSCRGCPYPAIRGACPLRLLLLQGGPWRARLLPGVAAAVVVGHLRKVWVGVVVRAVARVVLPKVLRCRVRAEGLGAGVVVVGEGRVVLLRRDGLQRMELLEGVRCEGGPVVVVVGMVGQAGQGPTYSRRDAPEPRGAVCC